MISGGFKGLSGVLILAAVSGANIARAADWYDDAPHGWSFLLPANASVCRSQASAANDWLLFRPAGVISPPCDGDIESGDRYISAGARFDADASVRIDDFVPSECPQLAYESQGRVTAIPPPLHSARIRWAACRIDGADASIQETLLGERSSRRGARKIAYRITLKTTPSYYKVDHASFLRWLATIKT